jgi:hypothetical protein
MQTRDTQSGQWIREGATLILRDVEPHAPAHEISFEVPAPPTPVRLRHFHIRKFPDPAAGGALMPDPSASAMTPAQMKPGYVLPNHPRRQALQRALTRLLQTKYSSALSPAANLRVALVDLTAAKQHTPTFAGFGAWGSGSAFEGGSLTKILALYAVYQLRFDLDTFAAQKGITKGSVLTSSITTEWKKAGLRSAPKLTALFTFTEAPASPVRATLRKTHDIHHNNVARELIVQLGFEYIGSVALQSGLFDEVQGGLWLNAAYNRPAITWTSSPFPALQRHNATALATATFFTLLAQGRLVNQATSKEIGNVLAIRVCMTGGLLEGIRRLGGVQAPSPNKCGILPPLYHEGIHVIRQIPAGKRLEYVVAVLSKEPPPIDFNVLGQDLDALIVAANP